MSGGRKTHLSELVMSRDHVVSLSTKLEIMAVLNHDLSNRCLEQLSRPYDRGFKAMACAAARSEVERGRSRCPLAAPGVPGKNEVMSRSELSASSESSRGVADEV